LNNRNTFSEAIFTNVIVCAWVYRRSEAEWFSLRFRLWWVLKEGKG